MIWKSNLTSVEISEDQENEAHEQICLNEIKHESGDGNKRESILVDARKSAVYRAEQQQESWTCRNMNFYWNNKI